MSTTLTVERSITCPVDAERAWKLVSDLDGYAAHTDGLAETTVVTGEELGSVRRCLTTDGRSWEETTTVWEPGHRYVVDVRIPTYPLLYRWMFRSFTCTWEVEPSGPHRSTIRMRFHGVGRSLPGVGALLDRATAALAASAEQTLASYCRVLTATT